MHFTVHSSAPAWAALAPHLLSVIHPVQLPSPAIARVPERSAMVIATAAKRILIKYPPPKTSLCRIGRAAQRWLALPSSSLYYALYRKMDEMQKRREDSLESSLCALT